jgi:hypothetical protein
VVQVPLPSVGAALGIGLKVIREKRVERLHPARHEILVDALLGHP